MSFQFQQKTVSKKGFIHYRFTSSQYSVIVHTEKDGDKIEVLYPVTVLPAGDGIAIMPDIIGLPKDRWELRMPPSISVEHLPALQQKLKEIPETIKELTDILGQIENKVYETEGGKCQS